MANEVTRRRFLGATSSVVVGSAAVNATSAQAAQAEPSDMIKIIAICCSPRQGQTTHASLEVCLEAAKSVNSRIEVSLIELAGKRINGSVAAGVPLEPGERDDFPALVPMLCDKQIGGVIIGTPVYFGCMTSLCKAFLERCITLRKNDFAWSNKVAGVLAVGGSRNGGQELTIQSVQAALMCHEMLIVGDGRPTAHRGATVWSGAGDNVTDDEYSMSSARNLGRRVAEVALRVAGGAASL